MLRALHGRKKYSRLAALCLTLLTLFLGRAFPEGPSDNLQASVLVVLVPLGGEKDLPFLGILSYSIRIELERADLEALILDPSELPATPVDPGKILEKYRKIQADFLMVGGYTSEGQEMKLDFKVYGVEGGELLASAEKRKRIDLTLDAAVTQALADIWPQVEDRVAEAVRRKMEAQEKARAAEAPVAVALAEREKAPAPAEEPAAGELPPPAEGAEPATAEAQSGPYQPEVLPAQAPTAEAEERRRARFRPLELAAGFAPFFPMARIGERLKLGYLALLYANYRWSSAIGILGIGLYSGYNTYLPQDEAKAAYFRTLIPFGVDLRLSTPEGIPLGLFLRALAGVALNVSAQEKVEGRLTRVLPQVKVGAGLTVAFARWIGLSVDFLYETMFYFYRIEEGGETRLGAEPVMGFNIPSVYIYTRW